MHKLICKKFITFWDLNMTELNVVKYIKQNSFQQLVDTYKLRVNYHKDYPNLVQLCYHQLDTPKDAISDNCRGLILDIDDDYRVVSFPFTRFSDYNYKNPGSNKVDFDDCKFYKNEDGSLTTLYFYDNKWNVSTKGLPDASGLIKGIDKSYNDYFWQVWDKLGYKLPEENTNLNFIFEMIIPTDSFLVQAKEPNIILLGIRNTETLEEMDICRYRTNISSHYNWNVVEDYEGYPLEIILQDILNVDPLTHEGYVACDSNFNRCKIKSPQYEAINLLRTNNFTNQEEWLNRADQIKKDNFRRLCQIVRVNNHSNFLKLEKYSEFKEPYKEISSRYKQIINTLENLIIQCEGLEGKELGLKCKQHPLCNIFMFAYRAGKIKSIKDYLYNIDIKMFETMITAQK